MCAAPRFLCVRVGTPLANSISARKFSRRQCRQIGGPAQPLRAGVGGRWYVVWLVASDSRSLLSAGERPLRHPPHFICLPGAAMMASLLAAGMQTATWLSAGMGQAFFSSQLARTRATKHEAAQAETEAVAGTAVVARARAV